MTKLLNFISRTPVIIALFIASAIIGFGFSFFQDAIGGTFLDMLYSGDAAKAVLADMSAAQKSAHIRATLLLDILFPLTLGGYMLGIAARVPKNLYNGKLRKWALIPAIVAIITDLCENAVQVMALSGNTSLLFLKTALTPIKYFAFYTAFLLAIFLLLIALVKWFKRSKK